MILKKNNWQTLCFYICVLLFYPLVWPRLFVGRLPYWSELSLFTPGLIALLCCFLLLSNPRALLVFFSYRAARIIGIAFSFILLIAFIQLVTLYNGRINYLWSSVYWVAIPLFCAVNRREVEKYLPFFMTILGFATAIQSFHDIRFGGNFYGITGNWNWNASLIMVTFPFICFGVYRYFHAFRKVSFGLNAILVFGGLLAVFFCDSKAAVLALIVAGVCVLILYYRQKLSGADWLRAGIFSLIVLMVLLIILKKQLSVILIEDQRFWFWSGALNLIRDHLWFGSGPELFESVYAPYVSDGYYLGRFVSVHHLHVHNHLLQFAATMGIPALAAWGSVIVFAVIKNLCQASGVGNWLLKLYLFAFILLFVHSLFDIVVLSWPLGCIFLTFLGILIGRAVENSVQKEIKLRKSIMFLSFVAAACCGIVLVNYLVLNLYSSMHYRNARLRLDEKNIKPAFAEIKQSIAYKPTPQNTFQAAQMAFYDFKNPQACLAFLDMLQALGFENYDHNNLLRAKALVKADKPADSLFYFEQEQQNFPLSCVNLYYYWFTLNKLGRKQQAAAIDRRMKYLLKLKGFDESMLPVLLRNPYKDLRFREFNEQEK